MVNAKQELLDCLSGNQLSIHDIKCGFVKNKVNLFSLKPNSNFKNLNIFLEELNFNYDSGYGSQNLEGLIWLNNGGWLERSEYDGSEWWEYKILPIIPNFLKD